MQEIRRQVAALLDGGLSLNEIARRLGVAGPTVAYHAARIRSAGEADGRAPPPRPPVARKQIATRELVAYLLAEGLSRSQIARRLGLSKATVSYHARRVGAPVDARCARRYDWGAIQRYYEAEDAEEVRSARERLRSAGVPETEWQDDGRFVRVQVADPDGYWVELFAY